MLFVIRLVINHHQSKHCRASDSVSSILMIYHCTRDSIIIGHDKAMAGNEKLINGREETRGGMGRRREEGGGEKGS